MQCNTPNQQVLRMQRMAKFKKTRNVTLRLEEELIKEVDLKSKGNRTLFIKNAIVNKISEQNKSELELSTMAKKVEGLNTKATEQKVADLEIKLQIIYEEIQRQNEVLVMTHRRSTLAANFSLNALNKILGSKEFTDRETPELIDITTKEIKNIGLQLSRK